MIHVTEVGRITTSGGLWKENVCYITGEHFADDRKLVILIPSGEIRKQLKKIKGNVCAYLTNVEELCEKVDSVEEFWLTLDKHKTPKIKLTTEQENYINIFIKAAYNCGYKNATRKKDGIVVCKMNGTSDTIRYNVHSDNIMYHNRRKHYLFDSFVENQKVTNVYNEFHKLLEDGKYSDYNALREIGSCVNKAVETANKIMGC